MTLSLGTSAHASCGGGGGGEAGGDDGTWKTWLMTIGWRYGTRNSGGVRASGGAHWGSTPPPGGDVGGEVGGDVGGEVGGDVGGDVGGGVVSQLGKASNCIVVFDCVTIPSPRNC